MADALLGFNGVLKYTVGTEGSGATTLNNCKNVNIKLSNDSGDSTTRGSSGYKTEEPTLIAMEISLTMVVDTSDTDYTAFRNAKFNRSKIGMTFYDEAAGKTINNTFKVHDFDHGQPIDGVQEVQVTLKPCRSSVAPSYT